MPLMKELSKVSQQPQHQGSTSDQLSLLVIAANRLGLYDAADVIKQILARKPASK